MRELEDRVLALIGIDRLREASLSLYGSIPADRPDLRDEVISWQAELTRLEAQHRIAEVSPRAYAKERKRLAQGLLRISRALAELQPQTAAPTPKGGLSVFLSYNHADTAAATDVRRHLEAAEISVRMDVDAMSAGTSIHDFIRSAIRSTLATVCILSERSLLSGWVGQETALALTALDLWGERRFIACYLDTRFLDADFRLFATKIIDERLAGIEALFPDYAAGRLDTNDLNAEKSRLFELRNELGNILDRVRGSLCLDIRPDARAASLARLTDTLRAAH